MRRIEKDKSFASEPMKCLLDGIHQASSRPKTIRHSGLFAVAMTHYNNLLTSSPAASVDVIIPSKQAAILVAFNLRRYSSFLTPALLISV